MKLIKEDVGLFGKRGLRWTLSLGLLGYIYFDDNGKGRALQRWRSYGLFILGRPHLWGRS